MTDKEKKWVVEKLEAILIYIRNTKNKPHPAIIEGAIKMILYFMLVEDKEVVKKLTKN